MALPLLSCLEFKLLWVFGGGSREGIHWEGVARGSFASQKTPCHKIFAKELGLVVKPSCTPFLKVWSTSFWIHKSASLDERQGCMYTWWEVVVKLKKLQNTYGKWSRNTSGDVFTNSRCWEAETLVNFQWCFVFLNPFGALGALLLLSVVLCRSYNTFLKDPVNNSVILIIQWPFSLFLVQGLQWTWL